MVTSSEREVSDARCGKDRQGGEDRFGRRRKRAASATALIRTELGRRKADPTKVQDRIGRLRNR
jgi:hypothetical protein